MSPVCHKHEKCYNMEVKWFVLFRQVMQQEGHCPWQINDLKVIIQIKLTRSISDWGEQECLGFLTVDGQMWRNAKNVWFLYDSSGQAVSNVGLRFIRRTPKSYSAVSSHIPGRYQEVFDVIYLHKLYGIWFWNLMSLSFVIHKASNFLSCLDKPNWECLWFTSGHYGKVLTFGLRRFSYDWQHVGAMVLCKLYLLAAIRILHNSSFYSFRNVYSVTFFRHLTFLILTLMQL